MGFSNDYFDILCGNDRRLVKVAVANNTFHTITIEADVARTIDFSGGTRKVDTIRLSKCFRAGRFIWPERTGAIRRLFISNLDALAYLDITQLDSLEELSIVNCKSLEEIRGIPASLKEINIHNCKVGKLDLSGAQNLQRINIITTMPSINIDASGLSDLLAVYIVTNKDYEDEARSKLNFNNCQSLYNLYVNSGDNYVDIDVAKCGILTNVYILTGELSKIDNLIDCKELDTFLNDNAKIDEPAKFIVNKAIKNKKRNLDKMDEAIAFSQAFKDTVLNHKPSMQDRETVIQQSGAKREFDHSRGVKISMLSIPEDLLRLVTEQDLHQVNRSIEFDSTGLFRNEPDKLIFHLQDNAEIKSADKVYPNALRFKPQSVDPDITMKEWLKGSNKPNILMLTEEDIRNPLIVRQLRYFIPMGRYWLYAGHRYKYRLYNRIFYYGDGYMLRNALPALAGLIAPLPFGALLHPSAPAAGFGRNATNRLAQQQMFSDLFRRELEMVQMYDRFMDYIHSQQEERRYQERLAGMEDPANPALASLRGTHDLPNQTPVDGSRSRNPFDDTPQTDISGGASRNQNPFDDQVPIDGDFGGSSGQPEYDDQQNIDAGADGPSKRNDEFDPQINIDGKSDGPPGDMQGKHAPQEAIDVDKDKQPFPDIEQTPIDADAQHKPFDIDDQTGIDANAAHKPHAFDDQINIDAGADSGPKLKDVDPMSPDPTHQDPLATDRKAKNIEPEPTPDQHLIDAKGEKHGPKDIDPLSAEHTHQEPIAADKKAKNLQADPTDDQNLLKGNGKKAAPKNVDPMQADSTHQELLARDLKAKNLQPDPVNDQQYTNQDKKAKEGLKDAPQMTVEPTDKQHLLNVDAKKQEPLKEADRLEIEETDKQHLLDMNKKIAAVAPMNPEVTPAQTFFGANKKREEIDIPEQVAIDATAESNPAISHTEILATARKLALAMKKMSEEIKDPNKSQEVVSEVIVKLNEDLAKPIDKKSFYDAAVSLTQALRALHDTCASELSGQVSLAKHKKTESKKENGKEQHLLSQLETIHHHYSEDNGLASRTEGMFGFKAGVASARSELLKTLIKSIRDKKQPSIALDSILDELKKDPSIRIAINTIEDDLVKTIKPFPKTSLDNN